MPEQNFSDRVLYNMDNLDVLRGMNSETVDLIATDPPFNKKRNRAASASQYEDAWRWADAPSMQERPDQWLWQPVHRIWLDQIQDENQALFQVIEATRLTQDDDTAAFLCFLGVRLLEMHRVLKPTGSIFLHCDHSANAYIRMVMDAIFGNENFRNEIVWQRTITRKGNLTRGLANDTDMIFRYSKSNDFVWHPEAVTIPYNLDELDAKTLGKYNQFDANGRRYQLTALVSPKQDPKSSRTYEVMGVTRTWRWTKERMGQEIAAGRVVQTKPGNVPRYIRYLDEQKGKTLNNVWTDIPALNSQAKERRGSPDQKPVELYERIIKAASNDNDIVLDPFAGCATTLVAAQNRGRRWVGIDRREDAAYHIADRLLDLGINVNEFQAQQQALMPEIQAACEIRYIPPVRTDDGDSGPHLGPVYRRRKPATMTRAAMMEIIAAQWGIRCWGCGFEPPSVEFLELDHIRPAAEGGSNELENRAPLCGPCNKRKSNTMTLTALRRDNRRADRWYGNSNIDQRIDLRLAGQWALDYLAQQRNPIGTPGVC